MHDIAELANPCRERVRGLPQGHVQGQVVKALGREARGTQLVAQEERLQAVEPQAVDDDDRYLPGVQPVGAGGFLTRMCSSASCASSASDGASVSGSHADCVFGKAMTSRMLSAPEIGRASCRERV